MNVLGVGNNAMTAGSVQGMSTAEEVIRERRRQEWLAQLDSQVKQKEALRAAERMKQTAEVVSTFDYAPQSLALHTQPTCCT